MRWCSDIVYIRVYHGTYNTDVRPQKKLVAKINGTRVGAGEHMGGPVAGGWGSWPRDKSPFMVEKSSPLRFHLQGPDPYFFLLVTWSFVRTIFP